uniref:AAA domain-containing protein n=1 Tax=Onchocerca volvulus TaxID=6282 RepID=A0A8R1TPK0_ONCVO
MNAFLNRPKKQNNASTTLMEIPWVEKYRPRKVEEVAFQNEVVSVLKKVLSGADLPNLLFYGPPGTGKTSAAIALCRQLFRNAETYHDRVMEMNASDERGINIVRSKIKEFARRAVSSHLPDGSPVVGLKVIILDEADAMTTPAQAALRRTMERESRTTRFFLICNYITRIIDPLTSRCAKFRFKSISSESQRERLEWICQNENVEFDPLAINELIELCDGDMRKSVTALQTISSCHKKLVPDDVRQFLGSVPDDVVEQFLAACKSLDHNQLYACVESIRREGYGVYQLLKQFFYVYLHLEDLSDLNKAAICEKIGLSFLFFFSSFVCEMRILDGANEFLQLLDFGTVVMEQFKMSL